MRGGPWRELRGGVDGGVDGAGLGGGRAAFRPGAAGAGPWAAARGPPACELRARHVVVMRRRSRCSLEGQRRGNRQVWADGFRLWAGPLERRRTDRMGRREK